ncbi:MAG: DUF4386 domain-containing protein [Candidatus Hodarchaeales archaeon]|jgi:hypothetical protein
MLTSSVILGTLYLLIPVFGILSVIPVLDDPNFLGKAFKAQKKVLFGCIFQFNLGMIYLLIGFLFLDSLRNQGIVISYTFVSLRIVVFIINLIAIFLVLRILNISKSISQVENQIVQDLKQQGDILRFKRDSFNHNYLIVILSLSNIILFSSLLQLDSLPDWLNLWGISGAFLSILASYLLIIKRTKIISPFYISLNLPTAIQEFVFALWLLFIGI